MLSEMIITYEVTPLTLAVLPEKSKTGMTSTCILEETREYVVPNHPTKVIDNACKFFGSSLKGRLEGTKKISRITHKAPIAIDPMSGMYFFPTASPTSKKCSWINHSHVEFINPKGKDQTEIVFKNGKKVIIDASYGSMLNQIQRTAQFRFALDQRIKLIQSSMEQENPKREE